MDQPIPVIISDTELEAAEHLPATSAGNVLMSAVVRDALCQTVRALKRKLETIIKDSDWRELYELVYVPKILPDDESVIYRDEAERLLRENTALREQLAAAIRERDANERVLEMVRANRNEVNRQRLEAESRLAQAEKERDELRDNMERLGRARARELDNHEH